ncbi:ribonuclease HII [Methylocucumis oryzae]|uniref:Ribonuclease HII n=1 Tax=Methylocucumis oryzae TaxID=1632867 RepID=A0A0F3IGB1_9GAMM|nr:ribonuclease HII [Methylocucumis oryzae]KJV05840.1 ribonuclease HII [Methylocucumis oryzae]
MLIAGVDEAGRGPWAGPVFAAAVILNPEYPIVGLADSKTLKPAKREYLAEQIQQYALSFAIASASVEEIDQLNILQATLLAMQRAVAGLALMPQQVLVDGNRAPKLAMPTQAIIKGDSLVEAISAASILAKVARDRLMLEYHQTYPDFAFHQHKGYGTAQHAKELKTFGVLAVHRKSFKPIRELLC